MWTPSIFSGLYLQGEGQVGLFHPFHQLLYRFLSLGTAFNLELIANYLFAFAGMIWFLRRLQFSHAAALFGAMLFAFSGFNLLHHHHINMVAIVAHLPWLLASADVLIVDERKRARTLALAAVAVILGSEFLLGFPQGVWWNAMTLAAFGVFRAGDTGRWRQLLPCMAAVALGVLLGGIQLLPSADAAVHSTRTGLSREFALNFSLHPFNLFQVWSPYFFARGAYSTGERMWFHEFGIYSGAILPVALIWVWIRRHALGERRALIAAVTVFARAEPDPRAGALRRNRGVAHASARVAVAPRAGSIHRSRAVFARDPGRRHDRRPAGDRGSTERRAQGTDGRPVDSGCARHRHDARAEHATPALRHAHIRERAGRTAGRRDCRGRDAAG